jgi:hypothetical protein
MGCVDGEGPQTCLAVARSAKADDTDGADPFARLERWPVSSGTHSPFAGQRFAPPGFSGGAIAPSLAPLALSAINLRRLSRTFAPEDTGHRSGAGVGKIQASDGRALPIRGSVVKLIAG